MKLLRRVYQEEIKTKEKNNIIFIDETGVDLSMTRYYGRSPTNERVYDSVPYKKGKRKNIIGGMSIKGLVSFFTTEGTVSGDLFLNYVENILCPNLTPNDTVVMDNLPSHKVEGVEEAINSKGAELLYLSPYSPEFSPIELCWSKLKNNLRKLKARNPESLDEGIEKSLEQVTTSDCIGWFRHCGIS